MDVCSINGNLVCGDLCVLLLAYTLTLLISDYNWKGDIITVFIYR